MKADAMTDYEMLRDYVEQGKESAFRVLVERHLTLVYGTALRQVRDPALAEEVAQNVFLLLARRAPFFIPGDLGGWLHKTALFKARERLREELRRQRREALAFELGATMKTGDSDQNPLADELDEALLELRDRDRRALLLRFFEDKSLAEVGAALGVSEDTAQKRVAKALDALAHVFRRRGHAVPGTVVVAAVLREGVRAAPHGLFTEITAQAVAAQGGMGAAIGTSLILAKIMSVTKTQIAAVCLVIAAAPITYQWKTARELSAESFSLEAQLATVQERLAAVRLRQPDSPPSSVWNAAPPVGETARPAPPMPGDPFVWSADADFVRVPKSLLPKISIPAVGDNGLMTADMARALELGEAQIQQVHDTLAQFYERYHAMENAHVQPSEEHPVSMRISPAAEQVSFIRSDFTEEYAPIVAQLKESLDRILGASRREYFWNNADGSPALSEREAAVAMRVTLFRPEKEEFGGGPYFYGQEFRSDSGVWGSASIRAVQSPDELDLPQLRALVEKWKREYVPQ